MKIILNIVTQRIVGSGTISRVSTLDAAAITIGRSTECDIQLQDLSVGLQHATLKESEPGWIRVTGIGSQSFQVNGRFTKDMRLRVADRPVLVFGGYQLVIAPGPADGEIEITVTRLVEARTAQQLDDDIRRLAPEAVGIPKRILAWGMAALLLILCLGLPTVTVLMHQAARFQFDRQWSAGHLSKAHAFLETRCASCHTTPFLSVRDSACLSCHKAEVKPQKRRELIAQMVQDGAREPLVFVRDHAAHARLVASMPGPEDHFGQAKRFVEEIFDHSEARCVGCHREHVVSATTTALPHNTHDDDGAKPALIMISSCAECHQQLSRRLPDAKVSDVADWGHHPEFRPTAAFSTGPAQRLDPKAAWRVQSGLQFSHRLHLLPAGAVARYGQELGAANGYGGALTCLSCHRPDQVSKGFKPIDVKRDCQSCHVLAFPGRGNSAVPLPHGSVEKVVSTISNYYGVGSPEGGDVIRGVFSRGGACFDCHTDLKRAPQIDHEAETLRRQASKTAISATPDQGREP